MLQNSLVLHFAFGREKKKREKLQKASYAVRSSEEKHCFFRAIYGSHAVAPSLLDIAPLPKPKGAA